jgi:hypothetical protein
VPPGAKPSIGSVASKLKAYRSNDTTPSGPGEVNWFSGPSAAVVVGYPLPNLSQVAEVVTIGDWRFLSIQRSDAIAAGVPASNPHQGSKSSKRRQKRFASGSIPTRRSTAQAAARSAQQKTIEAAETCTGTRMAGGGATVAPESDVFKAQQSKAGPLFANCRQRN